MSDLLQLENLTEDEARFDEMYLSVLQKVGKIEPFLDSVFKFLYRRTDFFLIQETKTQPYGFPQGVSKKIVNELFNRYDSIPKDGLKQRLIETNEELTKQSVVKPVTNQPTQASNLNKEVSEAIKEIEPSRSSTEEKIDPKKEEIKNNQQVFQSNPTSYNGAIRDGYSWTQSIKDLDVRVNISSQIKSSKEVKVRIEKDSLHVSVKNEKGTFEDIISDKLSWKIKPDESTWNLTPGKYIDIYLEKTQERWWENLLEKEEKIDLKNINPEKPMNELDTEAQAKINQLMYDQHQKRQGLPTSEEQKNLEILQKAWNLDGSPFKGTPFDPSVLKNTQN